VTQLQLLNLALLMVAEGLELDRPSTLSKFKYHTIKALGFPDVNLVSSSSTGAMGVSFGRGAPVPGPSSFVALAGLKRVLDCPKQVMVRLAEKPPTDQVAATELVGSAFLDVVPAFLNSGLDFGRLTYVQLRDALECIAITVYKHTIADSDTKLSDVLVAAIRTATKLLLEDTTSYDNKLLILLICTSFLNRHQRLAVTILLHQIPVVCAMMVAHRDDGLVAQATVFLQSAFTKFGTNGLFALLFKVSPPFYFSKRPS
jgi:hypothetical protein